MFLIDSNELLINQRSLSSEFTKGSYFLYTQIEIMFDNIYSTSFGPVSILLLVVILVIIALYFSKAKKQLPLVIGMSMGLAVTQLIFEGFNLYLIPAYLTVIVSNILIVMEELRKKA